MLATADATEAVDDEWEEEDDDESVVNVAEVEEGSALEVTWGTPFCNIDNNTCPALLS